MNRVVLLTVAYFGLSINVSFQVSQNAPFTIHVTKIQRVNGGCVVDAESTSIRFKLRSSVPAACAMLRSGESYEAFRANTTTDPKDETKDSSSLVIANNVKNSRRPNAVFTIDSEESIPQNLETGWTSGCCSLIPTQIARNGGGDIRRRWAPHLRYPAPASKSALIFAASASVGRSHISNSLSAT